MASSSWLRKIKLARIFWLLLALGALGVIFSFLIRNNPELLGQGRNETASAVQESDSSSGERVVDSSRNADSTTVERLSAQAPVSTSPNKSKPVVEVPSVVASPLDRPDLEVRFSVTLTLSGNQVLHEALFKRDELRVIVGEVVASMPVSELSIAKLRESVRDRTSALLQRGGVQNVMFNGFSIESKK